MTAYFSKAVETLLTRLLSGVAVTVPTVLPSTEKRTEPIGCSGLCPPPISAVTWLGLMATVIVGLGSVRADALGLPATSTVDSATTAETIMARRRFTGAG